MKKYESCRVAHERFLHHLARMHLRTLRLAFSECL